ncbi:unnamed protein product [Oppiella nova]|uniref:Uncharacterized protein n=1 Tax=Oppiella nova TaxID=334625 RepID=A0A7R9QGV7_9ACAR|nr:unnamed protein product [Oppiella nova]CAG2165682.1 unnamed protein product [Oppiella nova]
MSTSSKNGLIVAMDDIHIGSHDNETCSDYVLIQGSTSTATKWCRNKTDISGIEFPGQSHVDIGFHAANSTPSFGYCFSKNNTKCSSRDGKQCISNAYQCDGHRNCPEGDDENGCPLTPTTTITPTHHTTSSATPSTTPYTTHQTTHPTYVPPYPIPTPKPPGPSGGLLALLVMVSLIVGLKKRRDHSGYSCTV